MSQLPPSEHYRVYPQLPQELFFIDIETEGLEEEAKITCFATLNNGKTCSFSSESDFSGADEHLAKIRIAVTFHGKKFDIPRLMKQFPAFLPKYHIDFAEILKSHGIRGSLKDIAKNWGWPDLSLEVNITNGAEAAAAWQRFQKTRYPTILDSLLKYNRGDVRMLEFIARRLTLRLSQTFLV